MIILTSASAPLHSRKDKLSCPQPEHTYKTPSPHSEFLGGTESAPRTILPPVIDTSTVAGHSHVEAGLGSLEPQDKDSVCPPATYQGKLPPITTNRRNLRPTLILPAPPQYHFELFSQAPVASWGCEIDIQHDCCSNKTDKVPLQTSNAGISDERCIREAAVQANQFDVPSLQDSNVSFTSRLPEIKEVSAEASVVDRGENGKEVVGESVIAGTHTPGSTNTETSPSNSSLIGKAKLQKENMLLENTCNPSARFPLPPKKGSGPQKRSSRQKALQTSTTLPKKKLSAKKPRRHPAKVLEVQSDVVSDRNDTKQDCALHRLPRVKPTGPRRKMIKKLRSGKESLPGRSRYWTASEHRLFIKAIECMGPKDLRFISAMVRTRNMTQCRTHAQKCFMRLLREAYRDAANRTEYQKLYSEILNSEAFQKDIYSVPKVCGLSLLSVVCDELSSANQADN